MVGAGETDSFENHTFTSICYILFLAATIITHITFLNMLIAIMGDTFDRVIDQRPTYSLKNQIMILASMRSLIRSKQSVTDPDVFIYVIEPATSEGDEDESTGGGEGAWRGKLHFLQHLIKAKFARNSEHLEKSVVQLGQ